MQQGSIEDNTLTAIVWNDNLAGELIRKLGNPNEFSTDTYRIIARAAFKFYNAQNRPARAHIGDVLEAEIKSGQNGRFIEELIEQMAQLAPLLDEDFVRNKLDEFLDNQAMTRAVNKASDLLLKYEHEEARVLLREAANVRHDGQSTPPLPIQPWPILNEAALYGLAGDVVRTIAPHTESDPAALLFQFMTAFGNYVGRKPFFRVERDIHHANLFMALVGETSKARKGTGWGQTRQIFAEYDDNYWLKQCLYTGAIGSGEGIIHRVRDRGEDEGLDEKRLCVMMSEFASQLRIMERTGNIISTVIRDAWDNENLWSPLIKSNQERATGAHISVIGHITLEELRKYLTTTDIANGFANRFIFICAKRSNVLPFGGNLDAADVDTLARKVHEAAKLAGQFGEIKLDREAMDFYAPYYEGLSAGREGLIGSVTGRAEAQVRRLALLYTLLDQALVTRKEHIEAAMFAWMYASDSAQHIFGNATGDAVVDKIFAAIRGAPDGINRTEINALFSNNMSTGRIDKALATLARGGHVESLSTPTGQRGRPGIIWRIVKPRAEAS